MRTKLFSLIVFVSLLLGACSSAGPQPVEAAAIPTAIADTGIMAEGRLEPIHVAEIAFTAGGAVSEVLVKEGDQVNKGQVLVRLGDASYTNYATAKLASSKQLSAEFIQEQKTQTDILAYFILIMASLIAIVGGLGRMGTMSINVLERTRAIGVMRALGASNPDIQGIVIVEGLVIGLISWAAAILIAIPITSVLTRGVGLAILTAPMPAVHAISGLVAWLIFTLLLATVASASPAKSIPAHGEKRYAGIRIRAKTMASDRNLEVFNLARARLRVSAVLRHVKKQAIMPILPGVRDMEEKHIRIVTLVRF